MATGRDCPPAPSPSSRPLRITPSSSRPLEQHSSCNRRRAISFECAAAYSSPRTAASPPNRMAIAKPRPLRSFRTHPCTRPACQSLAIRQGRAALDATLSWLAIAVVIFKSPAPRFHMRTLSGTFSNPTARKARPTRQEFPHRILIWQ